jgi:hypothetical protein
MAKARKKAGAKTRKRRRAKARPRDPLANIPDEATIIGRDTLTAPDGTRYTILQTDQTDPYDPPVRKGSRRQ